MKAIESIPIRHLNANQKELSSESFSIRDVSKLLAGKDMVQEFHRHDFFYVLSLKKGAGDHEIDFTPYKICDRSVFFMRPGQVHQLRLKAGSTGYMMGFKSGFYNPRHKISSQLLRRVSNKNFCRFDTNGFEKIMSVLTSIFQEYSHKREEYEEVIKANLVIFFTELIRNRQNRENSLTPVAPYTQERLDLFLEFLETHISKHKQVSNYADMLNLSPYQLNAITKATLGKTCSELINEAIVLESKRHLLATSDQVNQIAYRLGYEDVSYFIRFFKKHTGYSPETFRHNSK
ncbi:transcriptional regulator [Cytophagales bacterium WSM2-2]|nr:transcriptional regulator [Cytophagales bacterium WSM2-2]